MSSSPFHGPSSSAHAPVGGCDVCDTVVLICVASATCLVVLTVAVCCRRAFADDDDGYARPRNAAAGGGAGRCGGLAPSAVASLPKLAYHRSGAGSSSRWAQCAICLAVVRDGEIVRLLPACGHLFHVGCIDPWLRSHATCPLCRRDVVGGEAVADKV